jgi:glycosyltransferase involved in cell wall biosynthesis
VTVLVPRLERGGAEIFAVELANRVDRSRFDVEVCVTRRGSEPDMAAALAETGLRVIDLDRSSLRHLTPWGGFVRHLRAHPADILHSHTFGANVWGSLVGRVARTPVIIATEHTWSYQGQPVRVLLDRHLIARNAAFVAVSAHDRARMIDVEHVPEEVIRVIPTGYVAKPSAPSEDLRSLLGVQRDAFIVGVVAGLRRQKALDLLIRAFATVRVRFPTARLVLIGDGAERDSLEALVRTLCLRDSVTFLGDRHDASELIDQVDVFALSSAYEGTPLALIEAMWKGRAIVATRVGGVPDMIVDGVSGLLVAPGSPPALADAIGRLLADASLRAELGTRAREHAVATYAFERCVEAWENLYCELYERSSERR